jgi:hypothetical protein
VERRSTVGLVVFAPKKHPVVEAYAGPPVRFVRRNGRLVEAGPTR